VAALPALCVQRSVIYPGQFIWTSGTSFPLDVRWNNLFSWLTCGCGCGIGFAVARGSDFRLQLQHLDVETEYTRKYFCRFQTFMAVP